MEELQAKFDAAENTGVFANTGPRIIRFTTVLHDQVVVKFAAFSPTYQHYIKS